MTKANFLTSIDLCSRCLTKEIISWVNENWQQINEIAKRQIAEELKIIKLKEGKCLVCDNKLVTDDSTQKVLKILEKTRVSEQTIAEFRKSFAC